VRVTDVQVHIWDIPDKKRPEWRSAFLADELEADMAVAGVDRVVLVPPGHHGDAAIDNDYSFKVAAENPERYAVMARLERESPREYLTEIAALPYVKGLRMSLKRWDVTDWVWPEAARLGLTVTILANRGAFDTLTPILDKYPQLSVLLSHIALPAPGPDPFADLDKVLALEKYKNVTIGFCSLARFSRESYPFNDVHPHMRRLIDSFGPERLAWGSNYNTHSDRATYRETVDLVRTAYGALSESDRELILDGTISRVLDWN
jgi:predicted TIM-barrel fold metal-dependent hydrolase